MVMEGSGLLRLDLELWVLGVSRRPTIFCDFDPVRRGWWLLRSISALWLGVLPAPWVVADAGGVQHRRREVDEDEDIRVVFHLYPLWVFLYVFVYVLCILATI